MTMVDTALCVLAFFMLTQIELLLWSSLVASFIIGTICVFRFNGFKHFFKMINKNELTEKTLKQLQGYEHLFNKSALILSIFDIITTLIICLTIGLFVSEKVTLVAIMLRGTIMAVRAGNNAIQLGKLFRSMRAIALVSGVYAMARGNKYLKGGQLMEAVKNVFKWLWANKKSLTGTLGVIAVGTFGVLEGTNTLNVEQFPALVIGGLNITPILFYVGLAALGLIGVFGKGYEGIKTFFTRMEILKAEQESVKLEKAQAKEEAKIAKLAEEQLALENKAKDEAEAKDKEARKAAIMAQLKAEAEKKTQ